MHFPLFWLAIVTLGILVVFAAWNYISTRRQQKHPGKTRGIGGKNDPLS